VAARQSFVVEFDYQMLGLHDAVANCSNAYSNNIVQVSVFAYHPCFSPDPIFDKQYRKVKQITVDGQSIESAVRLVRQSSPKWQNACPL
jgi:hypothetical protein